MFPFFVSKYTKRFMAPEIMNSLACLLSLFLYSLTDLEPVFLQDAIKLYWYISWISKNLSTSAKITFFSLAFFQVLNLFHKTLMECSLLLYFHHQHLRLIWDLSLVDIDSSQNFSDQSSSSCYVNASNLDKNITNKKDFP